MKGLANLTLAAINKSLIESQDKEERKHLGASVIGRQCAREIWLTFRWAKKKLWDGRMLRLFNRGHLEEDRFVAYLRSIGAEVWPVNEDDIDPKTKKPRQWRILDHKGHFGGSLDGVARGIPELPSEPVLTEFKTHNSKSFEKLVVNGVKEAKWEHFVQMNIYMHKMGLRHALYMAVNKDDDSLHCEIVEYDNYVAEGYLTRARDIIFSDEAPGKLHSREDAFGCKFCSFKHLCHRTEIPNINCRTCVYSAPGENGQWVCQLERPEVKDNQKGCSEHIFNPSMINGLQVVNFNPVDGYMDVLFWGKHSVRLGPQHYSSAQLLANGYPPF